jgi:hypothetical protein
MPEAADKLIYRPARNRPLMPKTEACGQIKACYKSFHWKTDVMGTKPADAALYNQDARGPRAEALS